MARPKRALTPEKVEEAHRYFERILNRADRYNGGGALRQKEGATPWETYKKAKDTLESLQSNVRYRYNSAENKSVARTDDEQQADCEAFRKWLDEYITDDAWNTCLINLRQRRFKRSHRVVTLKISIDTWVGLKNWAKDQSLTVDAAVAELLRRDEASKASRASTQRAR